MTQGRHDDVRPPRPGAGHRSDGHVIAGACAIGARAQEPAAKDYNQRSLEIYEFRKAAKSGPERGGEIYYYKCWFCHNEFTKDIPKLEGLFTRATLLSGQPVNDANVKAKMREGGPGMPSYRHVLNDADLNDLRAICARSAAGTRTLRRPTHATSRAEGGTIMANRNEPQFTVWMSVLACTLALLVAPAAQAQSGHKLLGGPRGIVKSSKGDLSKA